MPEAINNLGFQIIWNNNRHVVKIESGTNVGINIFVEGSVDKVNWSMVTQLTTDPDISSTGDTDNFRLAVTFDTHEIGGGDFPYKRLKFETINSGSPATPCMAQFIQIGITPTN